MNDGQPIEVKLRTPRTRPPWPGSREPCTYIIPRVDARENVLGGVWRVCPPREGACGPGAAAGRGGGPTGGGLGCLPRRGYRPRKADGARSVSSGRRAPRAYKTPCVVTSLLQPQYTPVKCAPRPLLLGARAGSRRARARGRQAVRARSRAIGARRAHARARVRARLHFFVLQYHCAVCACPLVPG